MVFSFTPELSGIHVIGDCLQIEDLIKAVNFWQQTIFTVTCELPTAPNQYSWQATKDIISSLTVAPHISQSTR